MQNSDMDAFAINPAQVRDVSSLLLDAEGCLRVVPARTLEATTPQERFLFGVREGVYSFPTEELCEFLRSRIAGRTAIEIGAGHGVLSQALSILATDNRQQEDEELKAYYQAIGQPTVRYGANVEKLDAAAAVEKYKPAVVVACWVTHQFDAAHPAAGGSRSGVNEASLIAQCDEYIFIGNEHVHTAKPIWALPHEKITPPWLYSRAINGTRDFIAVWRREATRLI